MHEGNGADDKAFNKAVKAADKLGEAIAKTTDKIMEMRKDIDGKQVAYKTSKLTTKEYRCLVRVFLL